MDEDGVKAYTQNVEVAGTRYKLTIVPTQTERVCDDIVIPLPPVESYTITLNISDLPEEFAKVINDNFKDLL